MAIKLYCWQTFQPLIKNFFMFVKNCRLLNDLSTVNLKTTPSIFNSYAKFFSLSYFQWSLIFGNIYILKNISLEILLKLSLFQCLKTWWVKTNSKNQNPLIPFLNQLNTGVVIFTLPVMSFIGYSIFRPF